MSTAGSSSWWRGLRKPRRLMLVSLAVLFVGQFFTCAVSTGFAHLSVDADFNTRGTYWYTYNPTGTGWQIHPAAKYALPLLAALYLTAVCENALFRRWGYWASLLPVFLCVSPLQWVTWGGKICLAGFLLAMAAAVRNKKELGVSRPPFAPPTAEPARTNP